MALFIAVQTFVTERRGRSEIIEAGQIAHARSWPVGLHPAAFAPLEVRWPAEPGSDDDEATPKKTTAAASHTGAQKPMSPASLKHRGGGRPMSMPT